ncbi:MAG: DmsE family decaheme c-type cytochrome [Burkholderiales bacterium]|nr:DmsE family decaheme c-type cytochrome [Burkholderiales bacterium]
MNIRRTATRALLLLATWALAAGAMAQPAAKPAKPAASAAGPGTQYSAKGADTCISCHDEEMDTASFTMTRVFKSKHVQRGNKHSPFGPGGLQCEACHGPGDRHSDKNSNAKLTINSQKPDSFMTVAQRNETCLACHQNSSRTGWHVGAHNSNQLACADCHKVHAERDPVMTKRNEAEVCYTCHKQQRADFHKGSAHPVRTGQMSCSDCHNAHGSTSTASLKKPTLNQTCTSCHADKRGPLLWEHAPVAEDCSSCHQSHGSPRPALLTKSTTQLCQQCHSAAGHPSVARTASSLPGLTPAPGGNTTLGGSVFLLAGGCTNCHSQVHGSNHPAGAKLMR